MNFETVIKFEQTVADYFGAPFGVATDCCTHAVELCILSDQYYSMKVPTRTYISIPFLALKYNMQLDWDPNEWTDYYEVAPNIYDAAVFWKKDGYLKGTKMCLSFQYQKHLSLGRGGMILLDNQDDYIKLKKMSYDGRLPNVPWREQNIETWGLHYYMTPETAQLGLDKMPAAIKTPPRQWKWTDWPDLRNMEVFKN